MGKCQLNIGTIGWQEHNQATSTLDKFYDPLNMVNTTVAHHHYAVGMPLKGHRFGNRDISLYVSALTLPSTMWQPSIPEAESAPIPETLFPLTNNFWDLAGFPLRL